MHELFLDILVLKSVESGNQLNHFQMTGPWKPISKLLMKKMFECEECHQFLPSFFNLKRNISNVYKNVNDYQCDVCGK